MKNIIKSLLLFAYILAGILTLLSVELFGYTGGHSQPQQTLLLPQLHEPNSVTLWYQQQLIESQKSRLQSLVQDPATRDDYQQLTKTYLAICSNSQIFYYCREAYKNSQQWRDTEPENIMASAYLGAAYIQMARDYPFQELWNMLTIPVITRFYFLRKGLYLFNNAIEQAPQNFTLRILRSEIYRSFPGKTETVQDDLNYILNHKDQVSTALYNQALYLQAEELEKRSLHHKAQIYWKKIVELNQVDHPSYRLATFKLN